MTRLAMPRLYISLFCLFAAFYSSAHADLSDGLVGYWPLDGDALDYSVNQNDGTLLTGASFVDNPTGEGQVLQTALGDVNYGHVEVGLPASYHPVRDLVGFTTSGAFWVMYQDRESISADPIWQTVIGNAPGLLYVSRKLSENRLWTMVKSVEFGHSQTQNYWPKSTMQSLPFEGRWHHIVWTFHSHNQGGDGHFRWYIDGELNAEYTSGVQTIGTSNFRIGASYSGKSPNSKIAEVRLYDRILTETEVYELATTSRLSAGTYPAWWQIPTEGSLELTYALGTPEADYAPVAVGQLKYLAAKARDELDAVLAPVGGAGPEITAIVDGFTVGAPSDLSVANLGQLKYLSSKFFDRFAAVGFTPGSAGWPSDLILDKGTPDNSPLYPWMDDVTAEAYSPAILGQVKYLFAWDISGWAAEQAPVLTVDNATVTVDAGQQAVNTGATIDIGGGALTLVGSIGAVQDHVDGSWTWSFDTIGVDDSQTVTITATDSHGNQGSIDFDLSVAPQVPDLPWEEIPDAWKLAAVNDPNKDFYDPDNAINNSSLLLPDDDYDGDGISNYQEYLNGSGPVDFFNGETPVLSIWWGDGQVGPPQEFLDQSLYVKVQNTQGAGYSNAPVQFDVVGGHAGLSTSRSTSDLQSRRLLRTLASGAQVDFYTPALESGTLDTTVTASLPGGQSIHFTLTTDANVLQPPGPPYDFGKSDNGDGTTTYTWRSNHGTGDFSVQEEQPSRSGNWVPLFTVAYSSLAAPTDGDRYTVTVDSNYSVISQ
jgi:hypothetical protein